MTIFTKEHPESDQVTTEIRWADVSKWKPGDWYPMPMGFMARDQREYIIEGYMIYEQDPDAHEDLMPVEPFGPMVFSQALAICEARNRRRMLE